MFSHLEPTDHQKVARSKMGSLAVDGLGVSDKELNRIVENVVENLTIEFPISSKSKPIAVILDDSLDSQIIILALAQLRIDCALIDRKTPEKLMQKMITQLNAQAVIAPEAFQVEKSIFRETFISYADLMKNKVVENQPRKTRDGFLVVFSSGSTGVPKGVVIPWKTIYAWMKLREGDWLRPGFSSPVVLNMSPNSWLTGTLSVLAALQGATVHSLNPLKYSINEVLAIITKIGPTVAYLTSNFADALAAAVVNKQDIKEIETIEHVMIGGTSLSWETLQKLKAIIPESAIFMHPLGASEAFRMFVFSSPFTQLIRSGKVPIGLPRDPTNLKLIEAEEDGVFEVWAKGEIAMGYLDKNQASSRFKVDENGETWWVSGDLVRFDKETGLYFHAGRKDDFVKINDHNVSLDDLELAILENPNVQRAVAIAIQINSRSRLIAFVEPATTSEIKQSDIYKFLRRTLPAYSIPHEIFLDEPIPMTRSGKPDKPKLRQRAEELLSRIS